MPLYKRFRWAPFLAAALVAACGPNPSSGSDGDGGTNGDGFITGDVATGDGGTCESNCDTEGARVCNSMNTKIRECRQVAGGCLQWMEAEDCAGQNMLCDENSNPVQCYVPPTCDDGEKNQDETDVDCGGSNCEPCGPGQACSQPDDCESGLCENNVCLLCSPTSFRCNGNWLEQCSQDGQSWNQQQHCEIANSEGCDADAGACHMLPPLGNGPNNPTGVYYEFARFTTANSPLIAGSPSDVDSFGDLIFVNRDGSHVDVYRVELQDTDGDGQLEPNQHPDNPDNPGPIEDRVLTFVETYDIPIGGQTTNELYVTADTVYYLVGQPATTLMTYDRNNGTTATFLSLPPEMPWGSRYANYGPYFQVLGYDDVRDLWFTGTADRYIFSYDPATGEWSWEFTHPDFDGDHEDGMEVVTDPNTGIPYVYVSDMTSDFIAQYTEDKNGRWVQLNLFQYYEEHADYVEGMGFGALHHFWIGGWQEALYEVGGGDMARYTEPFDPTHM